ncbi:hypothetical protein CH373_17755 [Leptospira perolatii]|uniref:Endonuclease/exonuclease/phosphatase domain-containing protein n=1 Tax=Leptospira perolatii TaxID=2023191 RepID=A0A2M9ZI70_9LEPT|nr:endonuclease/exonuclease/phosphatase family protein [Leptospira perolatii]PJZ68218.1 hypothetical protein CH360_17330 [Leptospira perolatii]PJZ71765.1 hypothetical protein CH373_17755 [Leptospira perolatii]
MIISGRSSILCLYLLLLIIVFAKDLSAIQVQFTSFNVMFLKEKVQHSSSVQNPNRRRSVRNFRNLEVLKEVIRKTRPDILSLQEVENRNAALLLLDSSYDCATTEDQFSSQEIGVCWRKTFPKPILKELSTLSFRRGLRKGLLASFSFQNKTIHIVAVHLKAGRSKSDRKERLAQIAELSKAISELENIVLLGDFNHDLENDRTAWKLLSGNRKLRSANHGHSPSCWQYKEGFIDYLISDHKWIGDSFQQIQFPSDDGRFDGNPESELELSDHCPITGSIDFEEK